MRCVLRTHIVEQQDEETGMLSFLTLCNDDHPMAAHYTHGPIGLLPFRQMIQWDMRAFITAPCHV